MELEFSNSSSSSSSSSSSFEKFSDEFKIIHDDNHKDNCRIKCSGEKFITTFPIEFSELSCITNISFIFCGIEEITNLPPYLTSLFLSNNKIKNIDTEKIPVSLKILDLTCNFIEELDVSNTFIEKLNISRNGIKYLKCNKTLVELIANNNVDLLVNYNDNHALTFINLSSVNLNNLNNIPRTLKKLIVYNNVLERIESDFEELEYINCTLNKIKSIDNFPKNLQTILISSNILEKLTINSSKLKYISCCSNKIQTILYDISSLSLINIVCYDNPLKLILNYNDSDINVDPHLLFNSPELIVYPLTFLTSFLHMYVNNSLSSTYDKEIKRLVLNSANYNIEGSELLEDNIASF